LWSEDKVAYLCRDGKTVRPIPGCEEEFADYCKQFRANNPETASKFIFEAPNEKAKTPHRRGKQTE
jgi:hypothetical protein